MKKEIKKKWVNALRSGKYKQAKGRLRYKDRYCPLGVLCDISRLGEWEEIDSISPGRYRFVTKPSDGRPPTESKAYLPKVVMNYACLLYTSPSPRDS